MPTTTSAINVTPLSVRQICWSQVSVACDRCHQPAERVGDVTRTALDIALDHPAVLAVEVSVHHCRSCRHFFRAQPPFLRPDAIYSRRVVQKAVEAVHEDGLAFRCVPHRCVPHRLARDFWVCPSEKMVRCWCRQYAAGIDFGVDYEPWLVRTFSGVLCVDEVYQGNLALLLAVDPAGPEGARLVGYELLEGSVDQTAMQAFLGRLREIGIIPEQVITDGSALYPAVLAQVWPTAAHQLCLFHEARGVVDAANAVIKAVRKALPVSPPTTRFTVGGRPRKSAPAEETVDTASQRWRAREAARQEGQALVRTLREQGHSLRAVSRQTGFTRRTIRGWLGRTPPPTPLSISTGSKTTDQSVAPASLSGVPVPPPPWQTWEQVRAVREALKRDRTLLLRRPDHLNKEEADRVQALLDSPAGADLRVARHFLVGWYDLWRDDKGDRRTVDEALARYRVWQADPVFRSLAPLRRVQDGITEERFQRLRAFLRDPTWQPTNNAAERGGRSFRHGQHPHFNLRRPWSIRNDLKVSAFLRQRRLTAPQPLLSYRCLRGRRSRASTCPPLAA